MPPPFCFVPIKIIDFQTIERHYLFFFFFCFLWLSRCWEINDFAVFGCCYKGFSKWLQRYSFDVCAVCEIFFCFKKVGFITLQKIISFAFNLYAKLLFQGRLLLKQILNLDSGNLSLYWKIDIKKGERMNCRNSIFKEARVWSFFSAQNTWKLLLKMRSQNHNQ